MAHREHRSVTGNEAAPPMTGPWARLPVIGALVGAAGLAMSLAVSRGRVEQFYFSWLTAFVFCISIALGGLLSLVGRVRRDLSGKRAAPPEEVSA